MTRTTMVIAAVGLILGSPLGAPANDEPDSLMPCAYITLRPGNVSGVGARLRLSCPTPSISPYDLPDEPANDPSIEGATLRVFDLGGNAGDDTYALPAGPSWHRIPSSPTHPLRGWRYRAHPDPALQGDHREGASGQGRVQEPGCDAHTAVQR